MTEGQNHSHIGRLILFTILWLTVFILSVKVSAAWATRSLSLMAESLHTLLTSFSTLLSLLRMTAPNRPTRVTIYGHGKQETAIAFLLVALLGFVGFNLLIMSVHRMIATIQGDLLLSSVQISFPLVLLLGIVIVISLGLAFLGLYHGKRLNHSALRFNASQLLKDAGLTLAVLIGILGVLWGWNWLDVLLTLFLVPLAVVGFWRIVYWQLPLLVEQTAIAPEVLAQIAYQAGGVTQCSQIQSRGIVGRLVYVQMHLILHPEFRGITSIILERIERMIQEEFGAAQVTFYIDDDRLEFPDSNHSPFNSDVNE
ncbi:MAG TPA: cation diffusion facilitator family transporter [Coleofasciculaceae cyanobacterium]